MVLRPLSGQSFSDNLFLVFVLGIRVGGQKNIYIAIFFRGVEEAVRSTDVEKEYGGECECECEYSAPV